MAFQENVASESKRDMNVVPLIDVLLVLLIIFMVTTPVASHSLVMDLPQPSPDPPPLGEPVHLRVDALGHYVLDGRAVGRRELDHALTDLVNRATHGGASQPLLQLDAGPELSYEAMADLVSLARNRGIENIGFVDVQPH